MSWWLSGLAALALSGAVEGQAATEIPMATTSACAPGAAPPGAICTVLGTAGLGETAGAPVSWALYDVTSGQGRHGLSVLLTPDPANPARTKIAASLPTSAEALERWQANPYVVADIVKRGEAEYAVMSVRGDEGPSAFSVHRADPSGWTLVDSTGLWPAVAAKLASLTKADCFVVAGDIDWRSFGLRYDMMGDEGSCGTAFLDLGVENGAVKITNAMAVRPDLKPPRRSRGRRR